ncbi:MAG TPA: heme-binding protein [Xanthobacteraceae bacterium]|jgi:uncharacterized protein GlcG (DUF336 family)|nr:heme-binding protein [Xanthobacteraceae bacterium]
MTSFAAAVRGAAIALPLAALIAAPAAAQGVLSTHRLSAALASEVVATAVATCAQENQQVTAVILDVSGVQQAMLRGDDAGIHTLETADSKAFTALTFKVDSIELVERAKKGSVSSAIAKAPRLLLAQGGVVIKVGDEVIGSIGVSGARGNNIDTKCARAGLEKIRDRMK